MTTAPTTPRLADDRQRGGHSPAMLGSGVRPVIHASLGNCGDEVPHVYDTTVMPPHPDKRCRCGKQTWRKSEIEMMELRLKTFAAAQPPKDRLETVGMDASEGVSAAPPRVSNTTATARLMKTERKTKGAKPNRQRRFAEARGYTAAVKKLRDLSNKLNRESLEWGHSGQICMASRKYEQSQAFKLAWLYLENQAAV